MSTTSRVARYTRNPRAHVRVDASARDGSPVDVLAEGENANAHEQTPAGWRPSVTASARRLRMFGRVAVQTGRAAAAPLAGTGQAVSSEAWWSARPPSLAQVTAYTRSGDWVPGDRAAVLEFAGKAYGYLLAIPLRVILYAVLWLTEKPLRLMIATAFAVAFHFALSSGNTESAVSVSINPAPLP